MTTAIPRYEPSARATLVLLGLILLAATMLRLPTLGVQSLWTDEGATWVQVNGSLPDVITRTAADNYPPLFNLLAWACVQLFGDAEWALRLPSALLGIANVWLLYALGARLGGRTAGLLAAALLALSGFHLWYSQEARAYSLLAFAATVHAFAIIAFVSRRSRRNALLAFFAGAALVYSHPFGALTWIAIGLGAAVVYALRRDLKGFAALAGLSLAIGLAFLPWALVLLGRAEAIAETGFWIPPVSPSVVWSAVHRATDYLVIPFALAACLVFTRRTPALAAAQNAAPILIAWCVLPLAMAIAASLLVEPVVHQRYLIGSLPALILLASLGIARAVRGRRAAALASAGAIVLGILTLAFVSPSSRTNWRSAAAYVKSSLTPTDCIILADTAVLTDNQNLAVWNYYLRPPQRCLLGSGAAEVPPVPTFVVTSTRDSETTRSLLTRLEEASGPPIEQAFYRVVVRRFAPNPGR